MKKIMFLFLIMVLFGCTAANKLQWDKNWQSENEGLTRKITVYSSFTGQILLERVIENSYFTTNNNSTDTIDIDILDLKTKKKTTIIGNNVILVIDEIK